MLDKEQTKEAGYKVVDSDTSLPDERKQKLERIKSILPNLINGDGLLDASALKDFLGVENLASANQGYSLNFAGKGLTKIKADEPTNQALKIEKAQSKSFDKTGNVIIRGDNLDVLKILRQNYAGKIKMIYIDPPYNTDRDSFIYEDSFKENEKDLIEKYDLNEETQDFFENLFSTKTHSGWLYFMYPRLKLARDLLADDGVIFISIDDNEQANLKIMCDEIFGENNFISSLVWYSNKNIMKGSNYVRKDHEYITFYKKGTLDKIKLENKDLVFSNPDNDPKGDWINTNATYTNGGYRYAIKLPDGSSCIKNWRFSEEDYKSGKINLLFKGNNVPRLKRYKKDYNTCNKTPSSLILDIATTTTGKNKMSKIFECSTAEIPFNNPKDSDLIKYLIEIVTNERSIILDFFAGSGTTAHAVMDLNKEDGGKRKFILVQWDEEIKENNKDSQAAYDFCKENNLEPVISSICIERVNRAGEKLKQESETPDKDLDIGYKVFSLTDRPKLQQDDGQISIPNLGDSQDILYNMMAGGGEALLTDPIEEIEPDLLYKVNNAHYVLGQCKTELKNMGKIFVNGYADISLEKWLNMLGLDKESVTILY